ncbi:hypothetical protein BC940DRAFT_289711 [Gongronella butleri]|nr:hypothetical protein BC940DRAFT_289711 [Gongronella butleri]
MSTSSKQPSWVRAPSADDADADKGKKKAHEGLDDRPQRKGKKQADPEGLPDDARDHDDTTTSTMMSYYGLLGHDDDDDQHVEDHGTMDELHALQEPSDKFDSDEGHGAQEEEEQAQEQEEDDDFEEEEEEEEVEEDDDEEEDDEEDDEEDLHELERVRRNFDRQLHRMFGSEQGNQLRSLLNTLKTQDDATMQLVALQELAEILSVSNEDTLAGYFPSDAFVKELVRILKGEDIIPQDGLDLDADMMLALALSGGLGSGGNPEIMLLACRCIANLLDAMPSAVTHVVYHGGITVLCQKLKSIEYIDLAEQALSALEKVSAQLPRAVTQEGGISAALMYFDFFSIHSQRTALRTAAACLRHMDKGGFAQVQEIIPTLMNTIAYPDRMVVELSCLCWLRIVESYRAHQELIEQIISLDTLKVILALIPVPGNTNAARPSTFMDLLRILRSIVKSSPNLACELVKLNLFDILFKVMTGVTSIPEDTELLTVHLTLDHKWRDSIYTMLKIVIDCLPSLPKGGQFSSKRFRHGNMTRSSPTPPQAGNDDVRVAMFGGNGAVLRHTNCLLIPLLLETHLSIVNVRVRQQITHLLVKLVHLSPEAELRAVLRDIAFSGFLASILTQQEHPALVTDALHITEMLLGKLTDVYLFDLQHEGVLHEIELLAALPTDTATSAKPGIATAADSNDTKTVGGSNDTTETSQSQANQADDDKQDEEDEESQDDKAAASVSRLLQRSGPHYAFLRSRFNLGSTGSDVNSSEKGIGQGAARLYIVQLAQVILQDVALRSVVHAPPPASAQKASSSHTHGQLHMDQLTQIANQLHRATIAPLDDATITNALSTLYEHATKTHHGISSFEWRTSGLLEALADFLSKKDNVDLVGNTPPPRAHRCALFQDVFFRSQHDHALKLLIKRLQELLARFEQHNVITPLDSSSSDTFRTPTAILAKQLRLRLTGNGHNVPADYRHLMVSTHAIATFHVIEEYLLARLALIDKTRAASSSLSSSASSVPAPIASSTETPIDPSTDVATDEDDQEPEHIDEMDLDEPFMEHDSPEAQSEEASTSKSAGKKGKWQIRFSLGNGTAVHNTDTIYHAIHQAETKQRAIGATSRNIWLSSYPVTFNRVWVQDDGKKDDKTQADTSFASNEEAKDDNATEPTPETSSSAQSNGEICAQALRVLQAVHELLEKAKLMDAELSHLFISRKLTAKVNRQLEEPLIVASACLPEWLYELTRDAPFLFPFETRYLFIQSTSFGYSRLISRWQSLQTRNHQHMGDRGGTLDDAQQQSLMLGRLERQKVRMSRHQMLDSAVKMMDMFATSTSVLEVEFVDEEGTGLGPTLEFYAATSKDFCKKALKIWIDDDDSYQEEPKERNAATTTQYVYAPRGLFPRPLLNHDPRVLTYFKALGRFVARSMLDFRIIDIPFSVAFFQCVMDDRPIDSELIKHVNPSMARTMDYLQRFIDQKREIYKNKNMSAQERTMALEKITVDGMLLDDLCLYFTLPGDPTAFLRPDGDQVPVTIQNVGTYLDELRDAIVGKGVAKQIEAFRHGFNDAFDIQDLKILSCDELVQLFSASTQEDWSMTTLRDAIKADHGYTMDSPAIHHFLTHLSELDEAGRRAFLQFTTGSPRLPIGGWKALRPPFTVVRKVADAPLTPDDFLPSVMTCANYLKMPDYSSKVIMAKRFLTAVTEGKDSFLLS